MSTLQNTLNKFKMKLLNVPSLKYQLSKDKEGQGLYLLLPIVLTNFNLPLHTYLCTGHATFNNTAAQ